MVSIISVCACSASSLFMRTNSDWPWLFVFFNCSFFSIFQWCRQSLFVPLVPPPTIWYPMCLPLAPPLPLCAHPLTLTDPVFFLFFNLHEHKTQCKIEFTYASHSVSKNLTLRRMLKNSFLIAQIIRWNNSFQNMYDMIKAKWTVWPGKLIFVTKKRLKSWTTFRIGWLWRVLEGKPITPGHF